MRNVFTNSGNTRSHQTQASGFTLIELLVVTALLVLVMGGSIAGYRRFNDRQIVITSAKELLVTLRQAQARASAGVRTAPSCLTTRLVGYKLTVAAGALDTYTLYENYASNCVSASSADYLVRSVKLPVGVTFQAPVTLTFTGLSGGVIFSGASPLTLTLCQSSCATGSLRYAVSVSRAGLVQDIGTL